MDPESVDFEQLLLTIRETFIYKPGLRKSASGFVAEDWGLDKPLFCGCCRVFQRNETLLIRIYRYKHPEQCGPIFGSLDYTSDDIELFCESHFSPLSSHQQSQNFFEPVVDSSRYFVIICTNEHSKQNIAIGIGFRDRKDSLDVKAIIDEFVHYCRRQRQADSHQPEVSVEAGHASRLEAARSFESGEKIHVSIPSHASAKSKQSSEAGDDDWNDFQQG